MDGRGSCTTSAASPPAPIRSCSPISTRCSRSRDNGITLDLVLLDHRWLFEGVGDTMADPVTGALLEARLPHGRAEVLHRRAARDALVDRVFAPVVRRYGHGGERADLAPSVFAFKFMNGPDFVVEEWEHNLSRHVGRPLPFELLAGMIARLSDLVHASGPSLVTLGGARLPTCGHGTIRRSVSTCCRCIRIRTSDIRRATSIRS